MFTLLLCLFFAYYSVFYYAYSVTMSSFHSVTLSYSVSLMI